MPIANSTRETEISSLQGKKERAWLRPSVNVGHGRGKLGKTEKKMTSGAGRKGQILLLYMSDIIL